VPTLYDGSGQAGGQRLLAGAAEALAAAAPLATRWIERLLAQHNPPLTVTHYLALRAIAILDEATRKRREGARSIESLDADTEPV
jgi:hypothetical protein